jgi:hypothetical protein
MVNANGLVAQILSPCLGFWRNFRDKMDAGMLKPEEAGDLWIFHAPIGGKFTEAPNAH